MSVGLLIHIVVPDLLEIANMTDLASLEDHLTSVKVTEKRLVIYRQALEERIEELSECQPTAGN